MDLNAPKAHCVISNRMLQFTCGAYNILKENMIRWQYASKYLCIAMKYLKIPRQTIAIQISNLQKLGYATVPSFV